MLDQFLMYGTLFLLIYEIYKEKYKLSNSITEIFYDFHNDPILLYEEGKALKANRSFINNFGNLAQVREAQHHSQMISEIINPRKIFFQVTRDHTREKMSLYDIVKNKKEMKETELVLKWRTGEKIFIFTYYELENIYHNKYVLVFKDTTHIHQLQKAKSQVEFKSVIMGCLTHELRTPVNCAISILRTMEDYLVD